MDGDIAGIRITPSIVEFYDTEPNTLYEVNITVKNISKTSKNIRYYGPKLKKFRLKVKNPENPVAPGLCIPAVLEYESPDAVKVKDRLVITVDGEVVEIPVHAHPAQPSLDVDRGVDFGNVVANSKVLSKTVKIVNNGSKPGEFRIKYNGDKPVSILPTSGIVPAKSMQSVKVELVANKADKIDEEFKVKLEGCDKSKCLRVRGNIMERALELLSIDTEEKMDCIKFGSTYYGTDKTQHAILYNNGPEPVSFVAILDEDAIAQEAGVDLTMTTEATLAEQCSPASRAKGKTNVLTSLVTAIPNQGILAPWEKTPVFFRFSPRWHDSRQGWKSQTEPAPRKDFALFMHIQMIGANNGFISKSDRVEKSNVEGTFVEVALTGTALPVLLDIQPKQKYDFGECPVGEHVDLLCTLNNKSNVLPATYEFRKIAHFSIHPPSGKISPKQSQDIIISFAPNQVGSFKPQQMLDVVGQVADDRNPIMYRFEVIHSFPLQFLGRSDPITVKRAAKFNPGITPQMTNEVGLYVDTKMSELKNNKPRNAVSYALKSKLHTHTSDVSGTDDEALVTYPNDRARSIRPSNRKESYKTIFTKSQRHNYIDPDYAYTVEEENVKKSHQTHYRQILRNMHQMRLNVTMEKEFLETNNSKDIGIKTAAGLRPKKLTQEEIKPDPHSPRPPNDFWKLLSRKELAEAELDSVSKPVQDGLNAVPLSDLEKADCTKILSPQELHRIIIGPPVVDFGEVCLRSVNTKDLNIINNLDQYIHVDAVVDCRELRQTSPLSQVIPPNSRATLPFIFESNNKGKFQRSVTYSVNGFYKDHVTVQAEVVSVGLELSTDNLVLHPSPGLPAEAGFRGVITLFNRHNYPADFTWSPNLGDKGTAFSIRPASGTVDAYKDLACEVVWHPSYLAPEDGSFSLVVHGGNTLQLQCKAELGDTLIRFTEHRILFGQAPVHLTTVKKALLQNPGQNHAYFQVMDPCPFPGLTIAPVHGMVPVGGQAELQISLTPDAILKFDTRLEVAIKGWKNIELRVGGSVEPPSVDIDVKDFSFGGVYCGSGNVINFKLTNRVATKARVEIDLTRHTDFSLNFPRYQTAEDYMYQLLNPGIFTVTLLPEQIVEGELIFMPSEVAAYDFVMPILINQTKAPTPISTPLTTSPNPSQKSSIHIVNPRPQKANIVTPRRHVIATALRQPLQLSTNQIEIALPCDFFEMAKASGVAHTKYTLEGTTLVNNSDKPLKWAFDLSKPNKALDEGAFRFVQASGVPFSQACEIGVEGTLDPGETETVCVNFCPSEPGVYECLVPVILNDDKEKPYQYLRVIGILKSPRIWFEPSSINLTPAPLVTEVSADFTILASQYRKVTKVNVALSEVESVDGSPVSPFKIYFPEGNEIKPCCGDEAQVEPFALPCRVIFSSPKPVSCRVELLFTDDDCKSFTLPVTATADNCLLSCYPFLAVHRTDHQIVCEQGVTLKGRKTVSKESVNAGEAVFVPCASPNHNSRPSTSATSSNFMVSTSSYETSVTESTGSTPMPRTGAMNNPPSASEQYSSKTRQDMASRSLGSAMFPDEDSEEGAFHMEVLMGAQRWFSSQGWPGGAYPITIPHTLCCGISRKPPDEDTGIKGKGGWHLSSVKKEYKTIYDMISHLSGRPMPGIPINTPLPADPVERVKQVYWQHSTLLTFLRCQGACVSSIKPQYLMEPRDFKLWKTLIEMERQAAESSQMTPTLEDEALEEEAFEAVSKRAWTDVLLQIFKSLVLAKITPRTMKRLALPNKTLSLPPVNADPLCSNVYSVGERILLAWLNHHYEHYRLQVWDNCPKGGVPPSRWVVNFDFDLLDGLVIGALLGAHMPFLIKSHLNDMYTHPNSAEQCLHNALKVVNAMRFAGIDYDIQAIDITDPNPITLLMLSYHLYQRLPQYIPKSTVDFTGSLHDKIVRQVKLSNPSSKPLVYQVLLAGRDARDFRVPKGEHVTVAPKSTYPLGIEFQSRFLRPTEAVLVLIGRRQGSAVGSTLVFNLGTQVDNIIPRSVVQVEGPCYELKKVSIPVTNPFDEAGEFQILLMENKGNSPGGDIGNSLSLLKPKEKKKKVVRSKIDHGQSKSESPVSPHIETTEKPLVMTNKQDSDTPMMNAFFSPSPSIYMMPHGTANVEINFLPFHTGERQCSVILTNDKIGELFYSIEANAHLPLSSVLPFKPTKHSVRISSAAAAGHGKGLYGGNDRVVYWKCEVGQTLNETLVIPVVNSTREKALLIASQQLMSDVEIERRRVTGTLLSSAVTARAISGLTSNPAALLLQAKKAPSTSFTVEINSKYYTAPSSVTIPVSGTPLPKGIDLDSVPPGINLEDGVMILPVKFKATQAGHYPCQILLKYQDDIRVVNVECTVNPEGSTAEIEFSAPIHHSVVQNLPIVNSTQEDWHLKATVEGEGFTGPPMLLAKAGQTTNYPLMFRPSYEAEITGKTILTNTKDRTDHVFMLRGQGEKPLALDNIQIQCEAKKSVIVPLMIPNQTIKKLTFAVESDLQCVGGNASISVLPGKSGIYNMEVMPSRRGVLKGVISFTAGKNPILEIDSDGDEIPSTDSESSEYYGDQVWYSLVIKVSRPAPERSLEVKSACHKRIVVEVLVRNPTSQEITLDVAVEGRDLSGPPFITLPAGSSDVYLLTYFPSVIGKFSGSLIFYNETVGEFWYDLVLIGESPDPTTLSHMECELGKWTSQIITLKNPTHENLQLITSVSNINNFTLERDNERPIELPPLSQIEIPVNFMPSALGTADHNAKISFFTQQLGEWIFSVSGTGLLPQPQEPSCVYTSAGSNTTLIIPFRNPTDHTVLVNILLKDKDKALEDLKGFPQAAEETPFCLLLKHRNQIRVGPKSTLDIPISFAPTNMVLYESLCTVVMRREDKQSWPYIPTDDKGNKLSSAGVEGLTEICWRFPIHGIPESQTVKDSQASVLECRARERVEERLEVILTGVAPSSSGQYPHKAMKTRAITPKNQPPQTPEGIIVGEGPIVAEEFTHHLVYDSKEAEETMKNSVAVSLVRQHRDKVSGLVALVLNLVYAPFKAMNYNVHLHVRAATGGVWKFPLKFVASEPEVDDTISIEATGLNRQSRVAFRLHSQSSHPEPYKAYFLGGSDPEFSVTPQTGELLPHGTGGTLIQVDFLPTVYGKLYQGKLIVQTSEMQWSYNVRGVLPDYSPPQGRSSAPISGPHPDPRARKERVNFIRNNLKLNTTAVSSPIKGAPVIQRMKIM